MRRPPSEALADSANTVPGRKLCRSVTRPPDGPADPTRLSPADAARMLGVALEAIQEDLDAGAPRNPDGRVNLVHYAAWLNLQLAGQTDASA